MIKQIVKYAFVFAFGICLSSSMFAVGLLVGKFGNDGLLGMSFGVMILAIFHVGFFCGRYRARNPL